jgi:hypothetical protein
MNKPLEKENITKESIMDNKSFNNLFLLCSDPRFDQEMVLRTLKPLSELIDAVRRRGLVGNMNKAYNWNIPSDGPLNPIRSLDIVCEVLEKPGYTLKKFMDAIADGKKL